MKQTETTPDYKTLQVGQKFHYTGDQANGSDFGEIIEVLPATKYTQLSYKCRFEETGKERVIMHQLFAKGIGQRFLTIEQYQQERAEKMAAFYARYPQLSK